MKKIVVLLSVLAVLAGCNSGGKIPSIKLKDDGHKTVYTMGIKLGETVKRLELNDQEKDAFIKGVWHTMNSVKPEVDVQAQLPKVQQYVNGRLTEIAGKIKKSGSKFIEDFIKKEGAKKTASGLAYKVLKEGKGAKPAAEDTVEVHYHGTLTDGTVFDSSVDRGQKAKFPLNRVIKGWTEGLQLIGEGGKVKLVIPSELGYGDRGAGAKIPGGAVLVFEVELFKIEKAKKQAKK